MTSSTLCPVAPSSPADAKTDAETVEYLCRAFNLKNYFGLCMQELPRIPHAQIPESNYRGAVAFLLATYLHWDGGFRAMILADLDLSPRRYLVYANRYRKAKRL